MSIRAQTAPTVVHLTRNLSPPIGAQRLRGPGAVLRELVGNSVPLPGNPSDDVGLVVTSTDDEYEITMRVAERLSDLLAGGLRLPAEVTRHRPCAT